MDTYFVKGIVVACCIVLTPTVSAQGAADGGGWVYEIGGASAYTTFGQDRTEFKARASTAWGIGNVCSFDPNVTVAGYLSDWERSLYGLQSSVISSVQAMVLGSALSKIRDLNPGLYDSISKGSVAGAEQYELALKNCRDVQDDVDNGRQPFNDWMKVSRKQTWQNSVASTTDALEAQRQAEETGGDGGVIWTGGIHAGGAGQQPIMVVGDVVTEGYKQWVEEDSPASLAAGSVKSAWADAVQARDWITDVVGEKQIRTCEGCQPLETKVGQGLRPKVNAERQLVTDELNTALTHTGRPDPASLDSLSVTAMGIVVTPDVIVALQKESDEARSILTGRLADEIAIARVLHRATIARELLVSGLQEPNVAANGQAVSDIEQRIAHLDRAVDNVLYATRIRDEVLNRTPRAILRRHQGQNTSLRTGAHSVPADTRTINQNGDIQ